VQFPRQLCNFFPNMFELFEKKMQNSLGNCAIA
jgi:hypothetical protein